MVYFLAMLVAVGAIATSMTFKWYKLLLIREHLPEIQPPVNAPVEIQFQPTPSPRSPAYPPPYSDKPNNHVEEEHHSESSLPPPYTRTSPTNPENRREDQDQQQLT